VGFVWVRKVDDKSTKVRWTCQQCLVTGFLNIPKAHFKAANALLPSPNPDNLVAAWTGDGTEARAGRHKGDRVSKPEPPQ